MKLKQLALICCLFWFATTFAVPKDTAVLYLVGANIECAMESAYMEYKWNKSFYMQADQINILFELGEPSRREYFRLIICETNRDIFIAQLQI